MLLGERVTGPGGDRWVLARGWSQSDRLEHVRRWTFASHERFAGQVRRLVRDAIGDHPASAAVARQALAWAGVPLPQHPDVDGPSSELPGTAESRLAPWGGVRP